MTYTGKTKQLYQLGIIRGSIVAKRGLESNNNSPNKYNTVQYRQQQHSGR